ncbi:hypothetical protein AL346_04645 [Chelatococcus sp. CO-6]|nr:hypothetical protein AL346_04645 [Chelatococcus sp. CO-6]
MRPFLPCNGFFAIAAGTSFLALEALGALAPHLGADPSPALRTAAVAAFGLGMLVLAYSLMPLMVRGFVALAIRAGILAPATSLVNRAVTDRIVVGIWCLWTLGLAIALPAIVSDLA